MKNFISKYNAMKNEQLNRQLAKSVNFAYGKEGSKSALEVVEPDLNDISVVVINPKSEMYRQHRLLNLKR